MSSSDTRSLPSSHTSWRASFPATWKIGQASDVCEQGIPHGGREVVELCEALGGKDERRSELAELAQHRLVVHAGHRLHLVDDDQRPSPLLRRQASLLAYDGVHEG